MTDHGFGPPHRYTSIGYDRAAPYRKDPAWLAARRSDPRSLVVLMRGLSVCVGAADDPTALVELGSLGLALGPDSPFLGLVDGCAVFALELADAAAPRRGAFVELRSLVATLDAREAGLLAHARALAHWHATHRFCGRCGGALEVTDGGHARRCPACAHEVFPRTDPAVIVLVTRGDTCVLGRAARFPEGMYSTLAGFVEPGESLESCLAREVLEEVGLEVVRPRYRSSQPWPFPQSLMLGFRAEAPAGELRIDRDELVDARWFTRAELQDPARRPVRLPAPDSIARFLIEEWLAEGR